MMNRDTAIVVFGDNGMDYDTADSCNVACAIDRSRKGAFPPEYIVGDTPVSTRAFIVRVTQIIDAFAWRERERCHAHAMQCAAWSKQNDKDVNDTGDNDG